MTSDSDSDNDSDSDSDSGTTWKADQKPQCHKQTPDGLLEGIPGMPLLRAACKLP